MVFTSTIATYSCKVFLQFFTLFLCKRGGGGGGGGERGGGRLMKQYSQKNTELHHFLSTPNHCFDRANGVEMSDCIYHKQ